MSAVLHCFVTYWALAAQRKRCCSLSRIIQKLFTMPDALNSWMEVSAQVDAWLQPLEGAACGPDLEYDAEYTTLATLAAGKPESQFAAAEPPDWARVRESAEALFARTRDLRVAMWWGRAKINTEGFVALPPVLALLHGLLNRFWDHLHPMPDPDDGDAFARLSVISGFDKLDSVLGDLRQSILVPSGPLGGLRVRDVEVATQRLAARDGEAPRTQGQISGMLGDMPEIAKALVRANEAALQGVKLLQDLVRDRFAMDMGVDLKVLRGMLAAVQSVLPVGAESLAPFDEPEVGAPADGGKKPANWRPSGVHSVDSRHDAVRAIELVCSYLERVEPTNPAQLLLRRAGRVIDKNFLQLVRELAPDAIKEVAKIMGVDPATIKDQN